MTPQTLFNLELLNWLACTPIDLRLPGVCSLHSELRLTHLTTGTSVSDEMLQFYGQSGVSVLHA